MTPWMNAVALIALAVAGCGGGTAPVVDAAVTMDTGAANDAGAAMDAAGDAVDCAAVCDGIAAICAGMSTIDDNWLSICRSNCEVRVAVEPEAARAEAACVAGAADCTTAVLCAVRSAGRAGLGAGQGAQPGLPRPANVSIARPAHSTSGANALLPSGSPAVTPHRRRSVALSVDVGAVPHSPAGG